METIKVWLALGNILAANLLLWTFEGNSKEA